MAKVAPSISAAGIGFTQLVFLDYAAARHLLWDGMLLQGLTLASTSVEKYLKAVLATQGFVGRGHLEVGTYARFLNTGLELTKILNGYLARFLMRTYRIRYIDGLFGPISLLIEHLKVLAELDWTISEIDSRFVIYPNSGSITDYQRAVAESDPAVLSHNWVVNGWDKKRFVERESAFQGIFIESGNVTFIVRGPRASMNDGLFCTGEITLDDSRTKIGLAFSSEEPKLTPAEVARRQSGSPDCSQTIPLKDFGET